MESIWKHMSQVCPCWCKLSLSRPIYYLLERQGNVCDLNWFPLWHRFKLKGHWASQVDLWSFLFEQEAGLWATQLCHANVVAGGQSFKECNIQTRSQIRSSGAVPLLHQCKIARSIWANASPTPVCQDISKDCLHRTNVMPNLPVYKSALKTLKSVSLKCFANASRLWVSSGTRRGA